MVAKMRFCWVSLSVSVLYMALASALVMREFVRIQILIATLHVHLYIWYLIYSRFKGHDSPSGAEGRVVDADDGWKFWRKPVLHEMR